MPTQEDRVLARIRVLQAYIRDSKEVKSEELYAWAILHLGVRDRTVAQYLNAMVLMDVVKHDLKTGKVTWIGNPTSPVMSDRPSGLASMGDAQ